MSTAILDFPAIDLVPEQAPKESLATASEKLAALRYLIVLTARWESAEGEEPERREQLRSDLVLLRRQYFDKIDEIAMNHGVQQAMDAKEGAERNVTVPKGARPPLRTPEAEQA